MNSGLTVATNGYYRSDPFELVDDRWCFTYLITEFWRFLPDGLWVSCARRDHRFDFWQLSETLGRERMEKARWEFPGISSSGEELFCVGSYTVANGILTADCESRAVYLPDGTWPRFRWRWEIAEHCLLPHAMRGEQYLQTRELQFCACRKNDNPEPIAEPSAAPNGGPATLLGDSGITEGPPSVS